MEKKKLLPTELADNVFEQIGKEWVLLGAAADGKANAMTISWGGMGVLWKKNVVFVFVRHSRHTFGLMEQAETFSLSWLDDPGHKLLAYMGKVSGRDEDKIAKSGLTMALRDGAPTFAQATQTMVCRKLYAQDQDPALFVDRAILDSCYTDRDWHRMYVGEILWIEQ